MEGPPTLEEIWEALSGVNSGKAAGKNGLLPELLKCCDVDLMGYIHDLLVVVWKEEDVPKEWHDALLVPVLKKGDHTPYNNWRMGKLFSKVLQRRPQELAEGLLSDSQYSFCSGRGCVDLIFNA